MIDQKWYIDFRYSCVIVAIDNTCSFSFKFNSFQLRLVDEHELCVYYGSKSLCMCAKFCSNVHFLKAMEIIIYMKRI